MTKDERRQAEIEAAKRWLLDGNGEKSYDTVEMLADFSLSRDEWVDVNDRLPEPGERRIWQTSVGNYFSGYLNGDRDKVYSTGGAVFEYLTEFVAHRPPPSPFVPPAPEQRGDEK